jgi:uncharacterized protein (TIGR02271 family)
MVNSSGSFGTKQTMIMSESPQVLDKHDENAGLVTGQPYAHPAGTGMGDGLAQAAIVPNETMTISENNEPLEKHDEKVDLISDQVDARSQATLKGNGLAKLAIAGLIGATLGTVAGALANKRTAESINRTVKGVGNAVKGAAEGVNHTVKGVGNAVKGTTEGVASGINDTLKGTGGINDTVKGASAAASVASDVQPSDNHSIKLYEERLVADKKQIKTAEVSIRKYVETQTTQISVPLKKERLVVEQTTPVEAQTPVAPGEAKFHEGEIARLCVYEETADVHKQAFVREEVSVRKEVEHDTVELEDTIRREELYLDTQDPNVIRGARSEE